MRATAAVSFSSGQEVPPVPAFQDALHSPMPLLPLQCMLYLPVGSCVLRMQLSGPATPSNFAATVAAPALRIDKIGALLVSLQGQLCSSRSRSQRMRLLGSRLLAERGEACTAALLIDDAALCDRAEHVARSASLRSLSPLPEHVQRALASAHLSAELSSLQLQLRLVLVAAERGIGLESLLQLNCQHESLIHERVRSDSIKQLQANEHTAAISASKDPLANTRTLPQLVGIENYARSVLSQGDLRRRWLQPLLLSATNIGDAGAPPTSSSMLAAYLLAPSAAAVADEILLSYTNTRFSSLNLVGPNNSGVWRIIIAYARALVERHALSKTVSSDKPRPQCVALSFALNNPPLLVYLTPALVAGTARSPFTGCLVAVEMGPTTAAPLPHPSHGSMLPRAPITTLPTGEIQWIEPEASLLLPGDEPLSSPVEDPLLPADHPVILEQQRSWVRPFILIHSIEHLPSWHSGGAAASKDLLTVWERVIATAQLISNDATPPADVDIVMNHALQFSPLGSDVLSPAAASDDMPLISPLSSDSHASSPPATTNDTATTITADSDTADTIARPLSPLLSLSPLLPPKSIMSEQQHEAALEEEEKINTSELLDVVSSPPPKSGGTGLYFKPLPPATPAPPPIAAVDAGTSSFRRRKLHAPVGAPPLPPSFNTTAVVNRSSQYAAVHATLDYPATPLAKQPPLELTMDTPRLHTVAAADVATPRLHVVTNANGTDVEMSAKNKRGSFLPPIDQRETAVDLLSKLQQVADGNEAHNEF